MSWVGGLLVAVVGFILGRVFNQSELVLSEKRRVYEAFLVDCPSPNEAYLEWSPQVEMDRQERLRKCLSPMLLYAAPRVVVAVERYLSLFTYADQELTPESPAMHAKVRELFKAHNDFALEMRRDALGWSVFGYRGKSRIDDVVAEISDRRTTE